MGPVPEPDAIPRRLERLGRSLGAREALHREGLEAAGARAERWRAEAESALARFHRAAAESGAPHLRVELSAVRLDDKHLRAVQFDLARGRHRALVTFPARGEVRLVGPFQAGKAEGPCRRLAPEAEEEIRAALGDLLERFLEEAATP